MGERGASEAHSGGGFYAREKRLFRNCRSAKLIYTPEMASPCETSLGQALPVGTLPSEMYAHKLFLKGYLPKRTLEDFLPKRWAFTQENLDVKAKKRKFGEAKIRAIAPCERLAR
jgi:hypothetical protein